MDPSMIAALYGGSALMSALQGMTGKRGRWGQLATQTPGQIGRSEQMGQMGLNQLQNPYQGFQPIAQNAMSQYQNQVVPGLAERFTSLGNNAMSSPAFSSDINQAGSGLQQALAAMQAQYGQQQQGNAMDMLRFGQAPQFENMYTPGGNTWLSGMFGAGSQAMGQAGGYGATKRWGGNQDISRLLQTLTGG